MENPYTDVLQCKKAETTPAKVALQNAFLVLAHRKPYASIGVSELCAKAHVARTTFYANYPNTAALLEEIENDLIADLLQVNDHKRNQIQASEEYATFMRNAEQFIDRHREPLYTMLVAQPDSGLIEKWKTGVKYHFWEIFQKEQTAAGEFGLEMVASIALAGYTYLLKNPKEFDMNEMLRMLNAAAEIIQY